MHRRRLLAATAATAAIAPWGLGGCASFTPRQPLQVTLSKVDGLPGEGLEMRLAVTLRFQNPNDAAVDYDGVALDLDISGQHLGSGVSSTQGSLPRFGEGLITVPVSISAMGLFRQAWRFTRETPEKLEFTARGRLAGGWWGGTPFTSTGRLTLPEGLLRS